MQNLVGTDPEVFLSLGGKFVSAFGLFPGTKDDPYRVEKGAIQVDGLALEFNIDPARNATEFNDNIKTVLSQMTEMVRNVDKNLRINFVPVAKFDREEFDLFPEEAKLLGCDPDFNVTGKINPAPEHLINTPIRTASGHVHVGWTQGQDPFAEHHFSDCLFVAKHFNNKVFSNLTYEERERLEYYGGNGSFRPKPYGVELRSYSNLWVASEEGRKKMFDFIQKSMSELTPN